MAGKELACVDNFGRPLVGGVQVVRDCTIPGRSQRDPRLLSDAESTAEIAAVGVVEGTHGAIRLANSLNRLDCRRAPRAMH